MRGRKQQSRAKQSRPRIRYPTTLPRAVCLHKASTDCAELQLLGGWLAGFLSWLGCKQRGMSFRILAAKHCACSMQAISADSSSSSCSGCGLFRDSAVLAVPSLKFVATGCLFLLHSAWAGLCHQLASMHAGCVRMTSSWQHSDTTNVYACTLVTQSPPQHG